MKEIRGDPKDIRDGIFRVSSSAEMPWSSVGVPWKSKGVPRNIRCGCSVKLPHTDVPWNFRARKIRGSSVTEHPRKFRWISAEIKRSSAELQLRMFRGTSVNGCSAELLCTGVPRNIRDGTSAEVPLDFHGNQKEFRGTSAADVPRNFRARMFRGTSVTELPRMFRDGCSAEHPCTEVPRNQHSASSTNHR